MSDTPPSEVQDDQRDPVEQLAEQFLEDLRAGRHATVEGYQQRYPQHASAIQALFPTLLMMEDVKPPQHRRDSADTLLDRRLERLGDFRIIKKIGVGGMGIVYEAHQESLDRRVAIKIFAPTLLSSPRLIRRFQREAKAAGGLHHSNIVPVLGIGQHWGVHYYIMQLIDGKSIDQILDPDGKRMQVEEAFRLRDDWNRIAEIGRQVASALSYAHGRDVLHRDIKPANLMLDRDGTAWVADFGLAKLMTEDDGVTRTGQAVGTIRYMAPEQYEGRFDPRSDVYSLGLTLYELLTWRRAFDESDHAALMRRKSLSMPSQPRAVNASIPLDLETIVLKCVAREPNHRYQSAALLKDDLVRFLAGEPILARRISPVERLVRWSQRNRALAITSACVVLLGLSVLGLSLWGSTKLRKALKGETTQRRRATATSTLATGALDSVFEKFGIAPFSGIDPGNERLLSSDAAALLEDLLKYYEDLASHDEQNPELRIKAAKAQTTIGDIRQRLGQLDSAIEAYQAAIERYQDRQDKPATRLAIASVLNNIGRAQRRKGDVSAGLESHRRAEAYLQKSPQELSSPDLVQASQFELARTYFLMGAVLRPGMGPNSFPPMAALRGPNEVDELVADADDGGRVELDKAIDLLRSLKKSQPDSAKHRQLLARCLREHVHDNLAARSAAENAQEAEALEILSRLVDEFPTHIDYQFDLIEALTEFSVFGTSLDASVIPEARRRLERAVELGAAFAGDRMEVASYVLGLTHVHFKLAKVLEFSANLNSGPRRMPELDQAAGHLRTAITSMDTLIDRFPDAEGFWTWQALFHYQLAGVELALDRPLAAQDALAVALDILEHSPEAETAVVERMVVLAYKRLDEVFIASGTPRHLRPDVTAEP